MPKTITIIQIRNNNKKPVEIPVEDFTALYIRRDTKLRDMAAAFAITIPGVRLAAEKMGLPQKSKNWRFRPKYNDVNFGELELRRLLVDEGLSYEQAGRTLGVSSYYIRREVNRLGIDTPGRSSHKHRECIPPLRSHRKPCEFLPVCRQLEPSGEPLRCEVILDDEPAADIIERDTAPGMRQSAAPYCNLTR